MLITFTPPECALSLREMATPACECSTGGGPLTRVVATPLIPEPEFPEVSGPMPTIPAY